MTRSISHTIGLLMLAGFSLLGHSLAHAEESERLGALIKQLGAKSFAKREAAVEAIAAFGIDAVPPLGETLESPDAMVRVYARYLITTILDKDRQQRIRTFQHGNGELPRWDTFCEIVGDGKNEREYFLGVSNREWELLTWVDWQPEGRELDKLEYANWQFLRERKHFQAPSKFDRSLLLLLMCESTNEEIQRYFDAGGGEIRVLWNMEDYGKFDQYVLSRLRNQWLLRCSQCETLDSEVRVGLLVRAMQSNLKGGAPLAKRMLSELGQLELDMYGEKSINWPIMTLAKCGSKSDSAALDPFLDDDRLITTSDGPVTAAPSQDDGSQSPQTCQVRDMALAAAIVVHGLDPRDFGFVKIQDAGTLPFLPSSVGFDTDEDRAAAFQKWSDLQRDSAER
ncbi:HEAT repeat domain-containing protein [Blastopirellula marina]|uniref:Uncharacterized protein n=1 Tax=Blastopirellula marina DSM 3645 TaxID=314230 RepID=A3ZXN7_9BACT|nr:hypothetical protein [Blastopirellula marina]EAQ78621.1 hypothetical protein DSM3645_07510 [Blastopirellula marina DSM 3645]